MDKKLLTPIGKKKLEEDLKELKKKLMLVVDKIKDAKELGDLSENAEYHAAKEEQGFIEGQINEIESLLRNATVVKPTNSKSKISIGSKITVEVNSECIDYEIVGVNEANPSGGKISAESPIGKALMGAKKDDIIEVTIPLGKIKYKILELK